MCECVWGCNRFFMLACACIRTRNRVKVAGPLVIALVGLAAVQGQHAGAGLLQPLGKLHGRVHAADNSYFRAHGDTQLRGQQLVSSEKRRKRESIYQI